VAGKMIKAGGFNVMPHNESFIKAGARAASIA
jgi:hypothetical protein